MRDKYSLEVFVFMSNSTSNLEDAMGISTSGVNLPLASAAGSQLAIDDSIVDLYQKAIDAFEEQINNAQLVEPRFAARNMEVAKMFLDSATELVHLRQRQEEHKDKKSIAERKLLGPGRGGLTQNNIFLGDRNEVLKKLVDSSDLPIERQDEEYIDIDLSEVVRNEDEDEA
jgi:hypothetical protein